jgi:chromosome partitioning protein
LDCPPTESLFTTAAYLASDYLLVPVKPEFLSTIGLQLLARSMSDFRDEFRDGQIQLAGIAFNATSEYSPEEMLSKRSVQQLANQHDWYVFDNEINYSRSYPKGAREGNPIFRTSNARWYRAEEFYSFAVEFSERVGL